MQMSTYKMRYPLTARTVSCPTGLPSMRMTLTVRGRMSLRTSTCAARTRITSRETFRPPPVEPADAPTIMRNTRITRENSGQRSKFSVPKPVVVMTDETENAA